MKTERFVITYGTSPVYPYEGGYSIVYATDMETARAMHAKKYGYAKDGCLRFAFSYTAEESKKFGCENGKMNSVLFPSDWRV